MEENKGGLKDKIKAFTYVELKNDICGVFLPDDKGELLLYDSDYTLIDGLYSFDSNLKHITIDSYEIVAFKNFEYPIESIYETFRKHIRIIAFSYSKNHYFML